MWNQSSFFPKVKNLFNPSASLCENCLLTRKVRREHLEYPQKARYLSALPPHLLCARMADKWQEVHWQEFGNFFHHCCQLKSSLLPKTKKKPSIVAKMTVFPVRTSAQAPHSIRCALANTIGSPKAETTMPVVRNMASSLQALLIASVSSTNLLAMQYGIGERT